MAHIKSRKHTVVRRVNACSAAVAMAFVALPGAAHAQQASGAGNSSDTTETLPQITVQGETQSFKADTVSSPKFTQPLLNTTQTITVIKKELVQEQGGTTLTEALRNTPGVGTFSLGENGATNTGDAIYMRGFDTSNSIFVDNVRDIGAISRDMFNIEQVEVTKGPAGADNGRGAPTGSINLVTKQPTLKESYSGSAAVGSGNFKRVTADLNKPLNLESGAAIRFNLLKDDSGVAGRDEVKNDREGVAAAFAFGLKTNTRTYLNYLHIDQHNRPDGGVPTIGLPGYSSSNAILNSSPKVDSKNYYGTTSDFDDVKADMFTVRIEHDFSENLKLQNTTRYGKTTQDFLGTSFMKIDPATLTLTRTNNQKDQENEIFSNQTNLIAKFTTGAIKHSLVTGLELTREKQSNVGYDAASLGTFAPSSLYNPDPNVQRIGYDPVRNGADSDGQTDTASVYLFDTLELNPQWQINGGIRADHYDTDYSSAVIGTTRNGFPVGLLHQMPDASKSGTLLNWKLGVLFKPTENSSLYANYATSKQPPGSANFSLSASGVSGNNSADFDPQSTRTAEVGGKWDVIDNKLALTAAVYRTKVSNEVEGNSTDGFFQTAKKRVQGIELGVIGDITRNWSISAGYTTMNTKVDGISVAADGSQGLSYTPKQAFTAWTTYRLPHGFTISGGARYIGEMNKPSDGATDVPKYIESYWVYDAAATYTISKNVDLQLNLYNLTDKDYVASINKSGYRYTPGIERSARLTLNVKF
ncbi:MAG TPA: catecholate siderophore receptor Fiu [Oxalicibacterium sp.]|nr:catecholate siderophore receptor Fiu [Oxalicibacterium sp.]